MNLSEKEEKMRKKAQKDFPEFTDIVDRMKGDSLEKKLLEYAKYREETLQHQANNEDLKAAKDEVAVINGPYQDTLAALKLKSAYLHLLLQEVAEVSGEVPSEENKVG